MMLRRTGENARASYPLPVVVPDEAAGADGAPGGPLPAAARAELRRALALLRGGNALARAAGTVARVAAVATGPMLRMGVRAAGGSVAALQPTVEAVLTRAFDVAILRLDAETTPASLARLRSHIAAGLSGAAGGAAGIAGFFPDAAFTTMVILRAIARTARAQGEDLADEETRRACLEVFAFGAPGTPASAKKNGGSELSPEGGENEGYWTARLLLQGAPLVRLVTEAASRLGIALSQKLALQAVPVAGAAGGVLVNTAFLDHYRSRAEGHFVIRRLERTYGAARVREAADELRDGRGR